MKTQIVKIRVQCRGKAPKRYGPNAYKFSFEVRSILERNAWTLLGIGRNYAYLAPPEGQLGRDTVVTISIPIDAEIERMAFALHEKGNRVIREVDGWIIAYQPATQHSLVPVDLLNRGEPIGPAQPFTVPAWFQFGSFDSWSIRLEWKDGDAAPPLWHRDDKNLISAAESLQSELALDGEPNTDYKSPTLLSDILREGDFQQELMNSYERNPEARRQCIKHYGVTCMVCGFNFAERYGEIGQGFIHVHHLTQLSDIKHEHEVDPIRDLRPICPNCHAMLHRRNPPYSLNELQSVLRERIK